MTRTRERPRALTAADVMSRSPVTIQHRMTLRGAARVLARWRAHALPVTDDQGRFVGVLSAADLLRWAADGGAGYDTAAWSDWQLMAPAAGRTDEVRWHLAADTAVVPHDASLADVARRMRDARACCAVVLDGRGRPVGVVSGADLIAPRPAATKALAVSGGS
jgi:CBS-domain-containing membrane protein